jgi:hypothetical protein
MNHQNVDDADIILLKGVDRHGGKQRKKKDRIRLEAADDIVGDEVVGDPRSKPLQIWMVPHGVSVWNDEGSASRRRTDANPHSCAVEVTVSYNRTTVIDRSFASAYLVDVFALCLHQGGKRQNREQRQRKPRALIYHDSSKPED